MEYNDLNTHVVKTSAQWCERAIEYWVVPRGCLCVELTPKGKTKIKVGEGMFKKLFFCTYKRRFI